LLHGKRSGRYRVLFTIQDHVVHVLHVRHGKRARLSKDELEL
jgi:mRNA-degrading endonuclease RelE of RelBE toxin-antitoxin system